MDLDPQGYKNYQKESVGPAFLMEGREAARPAVCKGAARNELQPEDTTMRM